jgi:hypothetical protein
MTSLSEDKIGRFPTKSFNTSSLSLSFPFLQMHESHELLLIQVGSGIGLDWNGVPSSWDSGYFQF